MRKKVRSQLRTKEAILPARAGASTSKVMRRSDSREREGWCLSALRGAANATVSPALIQSSSSPTPPAHQ